MSNAIFPTLPGLTFPVVKSPIYSTGIKTSVSGREIRRANFITPVYNIGLSFEFLRDTSAQQEFNTLKGFFEQRKGSFDSFLFSDPDDNSIAAEQIGVGNGINTSFQLARTYGGATEPVSNVIAASVTLAALEVIDDGALMWGGSDSDLMWSGSDSDLMWATLLTTPTAGDYTISPTGLLTFTCPPALGAAVVWAGQYYYRCRFLVDQLDFSKFLHQFWELKKCDLRGSLGVKV